MRLNNIRKLFSGRLMAQTIASLPVLPPGEEIYDIKAPIMSGLPWLEWCIQLLLLLFAVWLFLLIYRLLTKEPPRRAKPIVQSPQKQALRAILRLKLSPVWANRQMKEICEHLVAILKNYIKEAGGIGLGAAATSDEMLICLQNSNFKAETLKKIREFFAVCDTVRYTGKKYDADAEKLADTVEELVKSGGLNK